MLQPSSRKSADLDPLREGGYPALQESADAASLLGQKQFLNALRIRLGGLLLATVGGGVFLSLGWVRLGGWVALVGFLTALLTEWYTSATKPDRAWYEGRAAAESTKTLAWRYAVRGEPFQESSRATVDRDFVNSVGDVLSDLKDVDLASAVASEQITPKMREIRRSNFDQRRATYREGRVENQRAWYAKKSEDNRRIGHRWGVLVVAVEGLGVLSGVVIVANGVTVDMLGVFAATAATVTAWTQAKQYKTLGTAYGVTAQELAGVKSELDALEDESVWAKFVGQAEEAISREHTLWRASRGLKIAPRRGTS